MFQVNQQKWDVRIVHPTHFKLRRSDGSFSIGVCDDNDKVIYMSGAINGILFREVLCHEITHAVLFSYNISLSYNQEEIVANVLAKYGKEIVNITNKVYYKIKNGTRY